MTFIKFPNFFYFFSLIREDELNSNLIVEMEGKKTRLMKPTKLSDQAHEFTFDYSYSSLNKNDDNFTDQETIFKDLGMEIIDCAFEGFNACVFAYGQTGSGINIQIYKFHSYLI
jgi:hypothetical protein